jgi:hypothetical protein
MHVDVGIVRLERFINAACCICYGRFSHYHSPAVVWLALIMLFDVTLLRQAMTLSLAGNGLDYCVRFRRDSAPEVNQRDPDPCDRDTVAALRH